MAAIASVFVTKLATSKALIPNVIKVSHSFSLFAYIYIIIYNIIK